MIIIKCKYTKYFNYIDNTFMFLIELKFKRTIAYN